MKTCMNCGTSGCDHNDARRCANGHKLWTPEDPSDDLLAALIELTNRVESIVMPDQSTPDTSRARAAIEAASKAPNAELKGGR